MLWVWLYKSVITVDVLLLFLNFYLLLSLVCGIKERVKKVTAFTYENWSIIW
uniref:Uncharacterized protein n=1 Tax=Setaria italica TaxID=4555 RepID=K4A492_SETIT